MFNIFLLSLTLEVVTFIVAYNNLPPVVPLFYSRPWGESQLAKTYLLFLLPFLTLLFILINNFIKFRFFKGNEFIDKLITYYNLSTIFITTFIFIRIILLVS